MSVTASERSSALPTSRSSTARPTRAEREQDEQQDARPGAEDCAVGDARYDAVHYELLVIR
ncbi:hypothetical protein [Nonomuraea dietziae]|uniref:hypothetical protein n=1 Tax=Nonomuraea dietziae TaxID=65515 RepID=UPI0031D2EB9D